MHLTIDYVNQALYIFLGSCGGWAGEIAASGDRGASACRGSTEEAFITFYSEVKQIEKRDSVLTSTNQIERLTHPGSSYFNLNPFEVLHIDPEVIDEEIKEVSAIVHVGAS
uniref:Uncharacterized protein n=1 Tax=Sciurus vulgaris TaxID=55149 RepID=A0A8D2JL59_SCIVU